MRLENNTKVRLLNCKNASFTDKQGNNVAYAVATLIIDGQVLQITVDKNLITPLADVKDKEGIASFELYPDFKSKPKIKLVAFK